MTETTLSNTNRLRNWQFATVALMLIGYAGYYLCRSNLSVATPSIIKEFGAQGVNKEWIGGIVSVATLLYAAGKFVGGSLSDLWGGRRVFLFGMGASVACTVLFALGGMPFFLIVWSANRFVQSMGWGGIVKITSRWFSYSIYGSMMGIISLSYLFGDFASRQVLGKLITSGWGWREIFYFSAATLGVIFLANLVFLKASPKEIGEPEPASDPDSLYAEPEVVTKRESALELMRPLLSSGLFWTVCALSFGFTLLRETFNTWIPQYLHEVVKMEKGAAATASSYFPLFGGVSVILAGYLSDRLGKRGRAGIILVGLVLSIPAMLYLGYADFRGSEFGATVMLGAIAFALLGPYSFLAGAISLDFGGKRASATACGWIDGVGYIGGIIAGKGIGKIAQDYGWAQAFGFLAGVAGVSCIAAAIYFLQQARRPQSIEAKP